MGDVDFGDATETEGGTHDVWGGDGEGTEEGSGLPREAHCEMVMGEDHRASQRAWITVDGFASAAAWDQTNRKQILIPIGCDRDQIQRVRIS